MKTKLSKKILLQFVFLSLTLVTGVKKVFGAEISKWNAEISSTAGISIDYKLAFINAFKPFILIPILIIGLLFYGVYFYKIIRKRDKEKRKKLLKAGTVVIFIDIIFYIVFMIIVN